MSCNITSSQDDKCPEMSFSPVVEGVANRTSLSFEEWVTVNGNGSVISYMYIYIYKTTIPVFSKQNFYTENKCTSYTLYALIPLGRKILQADHQI